MITGYQVLDRICTSAGSHLHRARRASDGATVMLKLLDVETGASLQSARFRKEYGLLQSLDITGIVKPVALVEGQGHLAMELENLDGAPLDAVLQNNNLELPVCLRLSRQLAQTLAELHAANIVHQDIRPANLMLLQQQQQICFVDLSLATCDAPQTSSADNQYAGDWAYISPEQTGRMNRVVDHRTDFYSLGVLLYRMLSGRMPFDAGDPVEWVHCHIARLPRPLHEAAEGIPPQVSDIVMKLLAKVAEERYQSARGLQYDLERCLQQLASTGSVVPFVLGSQDASDRFQVPQHLYGRETEMAQLLSTFDHVVRCGQPALTLVTGQPGVGKSSLVRELHKPVVRERGYFITGKASQYKCDIPYATIRDALRHLVQHILCEQGERIGAWKTQLQAALGRNGQLIVDLVPQLQLVIGNQPAVPELPALEANNRMHQVFRRFIGLFATRSHPLVLFLDDMQWADAASLSLITHLLTHPETRCMMVIAAYRDNEVTPAHPLPIMLEGVQKAVFIRRIHPGPLDGDALCRLVADMLHYPQVRALPLAMLIQHKTGGNPFFVNQFLRMLQRDGLIAFDPQMLCWKWDLERITNADVTDNVVEWMAGQLSRLAPSSQSLLCLAACLGHQFELETLARVAESTSAELARQLAPAVQKGFLLVIRKTGKGAFPVDDKPAVNMRRTYRWAHDRVQQAARSLLPEDKLTEAHLHIGRRLLSDTPQEKLTENVFELVCHLNHSAGLITDSAERRQLAELNLKAAARARRSIAYAAARDYAATGVDMLPSAAWQTDYRLALALHNELIETTYLCRRVPEAEALLDATLGKACSAVDQAGLLRLRVIFATTQRDDAGAMRTGLQVLRLLGVHLPGDPNEWPAAVDAALARIDVVLADMPIEDLVDRPLMTDACSLAACDLLVELATASQSAAPRLNALLMATLVELSLANGNTGSSAFGYSQFGNILNVLRQDLARGYRFGKLAQRLARRFQRPELVAKVNLTVATYLEIWREPLQAIIPSYAASFTAEIEHGHLHFAGFNLLVPCGLRLACGERLDRLGASLSEALKFSEETANDLAFRSLRAMDGLVAALRSPAAPVASMDDVLEQLQDRTDITARFEHISELKRCVTFGAWHDALRLAQRPGAAALAAHGGYVSVEAAFYHALANSACYKSLNASARKPTLALIRASQERLAGWARSCPANFSHMALLLKAELERLIGSHDQAIDLYQQAIDAAARFGFIHLRALAAERAADACEIGGDPIHAKAFRKTARDAYAAWGADAKVKQFDAQQRPDPASGANGERLDLLCALKASQAMSPEIAPEKSMDRLMRVVLENAGAQIACLILPTESGLVLAAEARVEEQTVKVNLLKVNLLQENGMRAPVLPEFILNYVRHSVEQVLLDEADGAHLFSADPYLIQQRPKSVLCLPIVRQTRLLALLYLENKLATHAFTPGRIATLEQLAIQAAIALDSGRPASADWSRPSGLFFNGGATNPGA